MEPARNHPEPWQEPPSKRCGILSKGCIAQDLHHLGTILNHARNHLGHNVVNVKKTYSKSSISGVGAKWNHLGTTLNHGRNHSLIVGKSYAKREFQGSAPSRNHPEPCQEPPSKVRKPSTESLLLLAAPSPIIILNKRWGGPCEVRCRGPVAPNSFLDLVL